MNVKEYRGLGISRILVFHRFLTERFLWPYSGDQSSLYRWRAFILAAMLIAGLAFGLFALVAGVVLAVREDVWSLAIADLTGLVVCLILLFVHHIRFEIRAGITLAACYSIGIAVILSVGPLSGGPAWLFAFAVLSGVLAGNRGAMAAIILNGVSLAIISGLMHQGVIGHDFPFFKTPQAMIAAIVNFIVLNAITAVSVSALLEGLNTSEKRYRIMADNVADVIWTMDMDLKFSYVSPSVYQMQGFTADEMLEKTIEDILAPESLDHIEKLYAKKIALLARQDPDAWSPVVFDAEQYCKDGSVIWTSIHARLIKGQDGKSAGILGITRDITVQKEIDEKNIRAQAIASEREKLALVGQIAGKMAHDFNNVLGIIMGHAEFAIVDCRDEETKKTFELIVNQSLRGRNLTKNLVAFAKSSEPKQERFFLDEKVEFVLDLLKKDLEGIAIKKEWQGSMELMADPGMIEHTLVNLIHNAVHGVSLSQNPEIIIGINLTANQHIRFEIRDNGCGIPKEYIDDTVFEPSFTLKGSKDITGAFQKGIKGTGYGMANVKKYIELHKGEVRVESELGKYTKVIFQLPCVEKELTVEEKRMLQSTRPRSECAILLVEDEPAIAEVQHRLLTQEPLHHVVDIASNGQTAKDLFESNPYDLVSLDYILPGNINGKDVYTYIRKQNKTIPILFISGNIEFLESIKQLKQKDPYIDHLSKPCQNIDYVNRINTLLQ